MSDQGLSRSSVRSDGWDAPVCEMAWGHPGVRGTWTTPAAERSMAAMAALHLNAG